MTLLANLVDKLPGSLPPRRALPELFNQVAREKTPESGDLIFAAFQRWW